MTQETQPAVLIIDDDPGIRELLRTLTERIGCTAVTACNGSEALQKLQQESFDLLLLDLMMPVMNGYDVIEQMSTMTTPRPAVIVVTAGHEDARALERLDGRVVSSIVRKPFDISAVSDFIQVTANAVREARAA